MTDRPVDSRDEIELVEILRVIWKWKYLILVGTLVCALIAVVVNLNRPKIYRTGMVLRLGAVGKDRRGNKVYVDSPENVKALIESGRYNKEIRKYSKTIEGKGKAVNLQFKCGLPKRSNVLKITHETTSVDTGIKKLNFLYEQLLKEYKETVQEYQNKYEVKILSKLNQISELKEQQRIARNDVNYAQNRLKELVLELKSLDKNNDLLLENRDNLLKSTRENDVLVTFLYSNMLNQNMQLKNNYNNEVFNYLTIKQKAESDLKRVGQKLEFASKELDNLKLEKNNSRSFEIVKSPSGSREPIRPKMKLNVAIAVVVGLFMTVLMAFFLEYIRSKEKSERQ